jgi:hypothetical protein
LFSWIDSRVPAGLAIVALGIVLGVLSVSAPETWSIQRFWPLLVVGFGVLRIAEPSNRIEGGILVMVGVAVLLSNVGVYALPGREVVRYWPLTVVLVGVWEMVSSRGIGAKGEGFAVVFLGLWLQLSYFGAPHISSYRLWPLVLAAVGALMTWRGAAQRHASGRQRGSRRAYRHFRI